MYLKGCQVKVVEKTSMREQTFKLNSSFSAQKSSQIRDNSIQNSVIHENVFIESYSLVFTLVHSFVLLQTLHKVGKRRLGFALYCLHSNPLTYVFLRLFVHKATDDNFSFQRYILLRLNSWNLK